MEIGVLASFLLAIFAFTSTTVLFLMLRFSIDKKKTQPQNKLNLHSSFLGSISPLKRNIFTYLDKLFIRIAFLRVVVLVRYFCIKEIELRISSPQSGSFCARLSFGPLSPVLSRIICMTTGWLMAMIACIIILINGCRLFLVLYVRSDISWINKYLSLIFYPLANLSPKTL